MFSDLNWQYTRMRAEVSSLVGWHGRSWTNPATGRVYDVYLQIEQGPLCFKIAVEDGPDKIGPRDAWRSTLTDAARRTGQMIRPPRRIASGTWMTVARLERDDWIKLDADGLLDLDTRCLASEPRWIS